MTRRRTGEWEDIDPRFDAGGFRGPEVCRLAGITYRQLDYWARTGLVTSSVCEAQGSGSQRRWSREDVAYLRLIRELLDLGFDLQRIRELDRPLRLAIDTLAGTPFLVVTTSTAYAVSPADLADAVRKSVSTTVLNLDEICALDTDRDTEPVAVGSVRKTSTGVSTRAAAGL